MDVSKVNGSSQVNNSNWNRNMDQMAAAVQDESLRGEEDKTSHKSMDDKSLKSAVDVANKVLFKNDTHLKFEIHEKTKNVMVKIVDDTTGEVVKEIPPEKMLDMVAKLWEVAGILIDEKR